MAPEAGRAPALVLGSGSPRRRDLLAQLGVPFTVRVADVDERPLWTDDPIASVERSVLAKVRALRPTLAPHEILLAADTLVAVDGSVLGKPLDHGDAAKMLRQVSGSTLVVLTAVAAFGPGTLADGESEVVTTEVDLVALDDGAIERYLATGVAMDKAGALELQGEAAGFIASVRGCWSNVVGLPICAVSRMVAPRLSATGLRPLACSGTDCGRSAVGVV